MKIDSKRLKNIIDRFKKQKLLVIGDLILDEFIWGKVRRISPEAPVPVVEVERDSLRLGGSANVVSNLKALGCEVAIAGVIGSDTNGDRLRDLLEEMNVDCSGVVVKENRPTAIKTRVIAQHQQVVRFDRERAFPVSESTRKKITTYLKKDLKAISAVIISDYSKGVVSKELLSEIIPMINRMKVPIAVDPKPSNFLYYRDVTVITPNHNEAAEAAGLGAEDEEGITRTGTTLLKRQNARSILITRGEDGMSLFEKGGDITHIPTMARDVYDVTGAGDTVIATMALALASGAMLKEAAVMANYAAGIVVGKLGTATCSIEELIEAMECHR